MKSTLVLVLFIFSSCAAFAADYPSLLDVAVGEPFSHPFGTRNKDSDRPTTQFLAPNHGPTAAIFPEYSISYLNSSNDVVIVTAQRATVSLEECEDIKGKFSELLALKFPNYEIASIATSQLGDLGEHSHPNSNTYYIIRCQSSYGPFHYLHFQLRGVKQDGELRTAWDDFFGSQ